MIGAAIAAVVEGKDLDTSMMQASMRAILAGEASPVQIAALSVALRMKGETSIEIAAAAREMRAHCTRVEIGSDGPLLDTCGTGGDGTGSFNVSTISAIVVAAAGGRVAKHGSRAVSSRAGSADVLEALGISLDLSPERVSESVRELGIGFLFAPSYHQAMKHAAPVRKELGLRTFFNLLGPLANPASVSHQVLGVYAPGRVRQMAEVLGMLGVEGAWVVHGHGGLDEISPSGETRAARLIDGTVEERVLSPTDFGLVPEGGALSGGDAAQNAAIARALLAGERGARRNAVVMNAAAALEIAGLASDLRSAARIAEDAIDSGDAFRKLEAWIEFSRRG